MNKISFSDGEMPAAHHNSELNEYSIRWHNRNMGRGELSFYQIFNKVRATDYKWLLKWCTETVSNLVNLDYTDY